MCCSDLHVVVWPGCIWLTAPRIPVCVLGAGGGLEFEFWLLWGTCFLLVGIYPRCEKVKKSHECEKYLTVFMVLWLVEKNGSSYWRHIWKYREWNDNKTLINLIFTEQLAWSGSLFYPYDKPELDSVILTWHMSELKLRQIEEVTHDPGSSQRSPYPTSLHCLGDL